ncbi:kinase-like domain-containing protein, partial [Leptodontidium sp. 2 PMI_412]
EVFKEPKRGSYNICFFVQFRIDGKISEKGDRWVVRVPLSPCLAFGAQAKMEREFATMQLVAEKTKIPIPRIQTCSLLCDNPGVITQFMILEYIEGRTLSEVGLKTLSDEQRQHLYNQLACIYIQLRRLEFSSIGVLSCGPNGIDVCTRLISIGLNEQELEGLQPSCIHAGSKGRLVSASDYVSLLLNIAKNAFEKGKKSVYNEEDGNETLYNLHQFSQFTKEKWIDHTLDNGPFVLAHGDLEPHNIMVNEAMDIVALLDWEWSRVVPLQFFMPPTWLTYRGTDLLALPSLYTHYVSELDKFRQAVKDQELKMFNGSLLLSKEWTGVHEKGGILVQAALDNWTEMDYFVARYLDQLLHKHKDLEGRIESFMKEDPTRRAIVERKTRDFMAYCVELKSLGITDAAVPTSDVNMEIPCTWKQVLSRFTSGRSSFLLVAGASYLVWKYARRNPSTR